MHFESPVGFASQTEGTILGKAALSASVDGTHLLEDTMPELVVQRIFVSTKNTVKRNVQGKQIAGPREKIPAFLRDPESYRTVLEPACLGA